MIGKTILFMIALFLILFIISESNILKMPFWLVTIPLWLPILLFIGVVGLYMMGMYIWYA